MGLTMPKAESASNKSGIDMDVAEKMHEYVEPHERKDGPWEEHELDHAGRHLERAEQIKDNPKFMGAIAKHHEAKAKHHREIATEMKHHMRRGLVSESAAKKAMGEGSTPVRAEHHGNRDQSQSKETGSRGPEHLGKVKGERR